MHDDDEERFPRITLWQFLKGAILAPLTLLEFVFGYGLIADLTGSWRKTRKKQRGTDPDRRISPQPPDRID